MPDPTRDTFAEWMESAVEVAVGTGRSVPLEVRRIEDYGDGDGHRFSVFLSGSAGTPLGQGSYEVRMGGDSFVLFLVPVGREGDECTYEAAFNRLPGV